MECIIVNGKKIQTKYAVTNDEHQTGLMYQAWPPPVMTFLFPKLAVHKFWMMNTPSPLDIIFCNDNKVISICAGEPHSLSMIGPDEKSDMVIEMPRGMASDLGIRVNDYIESRLGIDTFIKKSNLT